MKKPTTLLHFSGGMDSTYVLYSFLRDNPDEFVLVHHIQLRHHAEDRLVEEQQAVDNILNWLRKNGFNNFIYHQSAFDYGSLPRISIKDIQIVALFTGIIIRTHIGSGIRKLLLSWHLGEVNREDIQKGFRIKAMLQALDCGEDLEYVFPIEFMDRRQMAEDMPEELLEMANSCRKPLKGRNCCRCKTCLELKEAGILHIVGRRNHKNFIEI